MLRLLMLLLLPATLCGQLSQGDLLFTLVTSESCQGDDPVRLIGFLPDMNNAPIPEGGVYAIESCIESPCANDAIFFNSTDGFYYFDPIAKEDSYIISYTISNPIFEEKYITQFDLQAANSQILLLQSEVCQNDIVQIYPNPQGGQLSGEGVFSRTVFGEDFHYFDPTGLVNDSTYTIRYDYSITASSGLVCSDMSFATVDVFEDVEIVIASDSIEVCSLGVLPLNATLTGDTTEVRVTWYNPSFDSIYNNLKFSTDTITTSGTYYVQVINENGCDDLKSVFVKVNQPPKLTCTKIKDASCYQAADGSIRIDVVGSDAQDFEVMWSDGGQKLLRSNLSAGIYTITVEDNKNCSESCTLEITEPEPVLVKCEDSLIKPTCFNGLDGSNVLEITGGTTPYLTSLDSVNFNPTEVLSELPTGDFLVYILDANNCSAQCAFTILETAPDTCFVVPTSQVTCSGGSDGSLTVSFSADYQSVLWSNGDTTLVNDSLTAGIYTVTITSTRGCVSVCQGEIVQPDPLVLLEGEIKNPICYGTETGSIQVNAVGGTLPYQYSLNGAAYTTDNVFINLAGGDYTIAVMDANSCVDSIDIIILEPYLLNGFIEEENAIACYGEASAALLVRPSDEVTNILWSTGSSDTMITNLSAGTYSVTLSDDLDCEVVFNQTISEPDSLELVSAVITDNICFGDSTGTIDLVVEGGALPYNYVWSPKGPDSLTAGQYFVTITDANGCKIENSFEVEEPEDIDAVMLRQQPSCYGANDGQLTITTQANNPTFLWNTGATTPTISVGVGLYEVTVTTADDCVKSFVSELLQPDTLAVSVITEIPVCFGEANGYAEVQVTGGVAPYNYSLNGEAPVTEHLFTSLPSGNYTISVTDANGCITQLDFIIDDPYLLNGFIEEENAIACYGEASAALLVRPSDEVTNILWSTGSSDTMITNLVAGTYGVTLSDDLDCEVVLNQTISEPDSLELVSAVITDNICFGGSTGTIDLVVEGGALPYNYVWSPKGPDGLTAGQYFVNITDANGCIIEDNFEVEEPEDIEAEIIVEQPSCFGVNDGQLSITTEASNPTYLWSNGATTPTITLGAGSYEVTVTTEDNCSKTFMTLLEQKAPLVVNIEAEMALSCFDSNDAMLALKIEGGTMPYNVMWGDNSNELLRDNLGAGSYAVRVADANGCVAFANYEIDPLEAKSVDAVLTPPLCFGEASGSIELISNEDLGASVITWSVSGYDDSTLATELLAGQYDVTITFPDSCRQTYQFVLDDHPELLIDDLEVEGVKCNGDSTGRIEVTPTGGVMPYTYKWSTGSISNNIENLNAGRYAVSVTDSNSCSIVSDAIIVPENTAWSIAVTDTESCLDEKITLSASLTGIAADDLTFEWSITSSTLPVNDELLIDQEQNNIVFDAYKLQEGDVIVQCKVTDAFGCEAVSSMQLSLRSCFDLALRKRVVGEALVELGESVIFNIEVFNQGSITAYDLTIEDFPDEDLIFIEEKNTSAATGNPYDWSYENGSITTKIDSIVTQDKVDLVIYFQMASDPEKNQFVNVAEIIDYSSYNSRLPIDEDDLLSDMPEECDDDIEDDSTGGIDTPKDDDQQDFASVHICPRFDHEASIELCGTATLSMLLSESIYAELDPEGDGDGDMSDGDTGNRIVSFHQNIQEALNGDSNSASSISTVSRTETVYARMTTTDGCLLAIPLELEVHALPEVPVLPPDIIATAGEDVTLSFQPIAGFTYQWQRSSPTGYVDIKGETAPTLVLESISASDNRNRYRVLVSENHSSARCTETSSTIELQVMPEVLVCAGNLNVGLNADCGLDLSVSQLLQGTILDDSLYNISYLNLNNEEIGQADFVDYVNQQISFRVENNLNDASCWGYLVINDVSPPVLFCPDRITLSCMVDGNLEDHLQVFGEDNCSLSKIVVADSYKVNDCSDVDSRRYVSNHILTAYAEDSYGNKSSSCEIEIYYEALTDLEVIFPLNLTLNGEDWDMNYNNYPDPIETGTVVDASGEAIDQIESQCNIKVHYEDVRYDLCGESYMIFREWTVVDWCSQSVQSRLQYIKVIDRSGPELQHALLDTTIFTTAINCKALFKPLAEHVEEQSSFKHFQLSYYRQNDTDSLFSLYAIFPQDSTQLLELGIGIYRFDFKYYDDCGHYSLGQTFLDIRANNSISAICRGTLTVNLAEQEQLTLWAEELDNQTLSICDMRLGYGARVIPDLSISEEQPIYSANGHDYYKTIDVDSQVDSLELIVFYKNQYSICRTDFKTVSLGKRSSDVSNDEEHTHVDMESIKVYPNPFTSQLYISVNAEERQKVRIDIYSIEGTNVYAQEHILEQGPQEILIPETHLMTEAGTYMIIINGKTINHTSKLVRVN